MVAVAVYENAGKNRRRHKKPLDETGNILTPNQLAERLQVKTSCAVGMRTREGKTHRSTENRR
jgi:hypothetical protein